MRAVDNNKLESMEIVGSKVIVWNPSYDYFELQGDKVVYTYGLPEGQEESGDNPEDFNFCPTREDAVDRLKKELRSLTETKKLLEKVLDALNKGAKYEANAE